MKLRITLVCITVMYIGYCALAQTTGTVTDYDGNMDTTVKIGNQ